MSQRLQDAIVFVEAYGQIAAQTVTKGSPDLNVPAMLPTRHRLWTPRNTSVTI
jgi:hypothetical protein